MFKYDAQVSLLNLCAQKMFEMYIFKLWGCLEHFFVAVTNIKEEIVVNLGLKYWRNYKISAKPFNVLKVFKKSINIF